MKTKLFLLTLIFAFTSCLDVELEPEKGDTVNNTFVDFGAFQAYAAKVYASLTLTGQQGAAGRPDLTIINDEGFSSYLRVLWKAQELTTDEAIIAWTDSGIRDLHNHSWSSDNQFVRVLYYRIFYTVSLANDFLDVSSSLPSDLSQAESDQIESYRNEIRFIRALAYSHALDMYRNVPLITSISSDLPQQVAPLRIFEFIESELNEIGPSLPAIGQGEYGRVDQGAVEMLFARIYLNAQVYIGQDRYADVTTHVNNVINSGQYSTAADYPSLFRGDNHLRQADESIWAIVHDGEVSQTWGGTTTLVRGGIGAAMMDNEDQLGTPKPNEALIDYGVPSGWEGYRTTSAFVNLFPFTNDPVTDNGVSADNRAIFFTEGQSLEIANIGTFTDGFAVPKWTNLLENGNRAPGVDQVSTDFHVFRLAEAYLMLAEAQVRTNGAVDATTLGYLNELRLRAYGDNTGNVTSGEVTLDWILDERGRELYLEGHRRTDLVRFNQFSGGAYIWPWKGGVPEGRSTDAHLDIFPIPASELIANPRMIQNTGY